MLSADPERAERHDGLLTSGGRSRGGILALCWVTPTPARRQHAAVSHEQSAADLRVSGKTCISALLSLCPGWFISSRVARAQAGVLLRRLKFALPGWTEVESRRGAWAQKSAQRAAQARAFSGEGHSEEWGFFFSGSSH